MYEKILILGNGFDLDLGMKTKYSDFMNSKIWENAKKKDGVLSYKIIDYIEKKSKLENWFDVEAELLYYALDVTDGTYYTPQVTDRGGFEVFQTKLKEYLLNEQENAKIEPYSAALTVMNNVIYNGLFTNIYTFNYTNVSRLMGKVNIPVKIPITYMHGSLEKNDNIVLGIETDKQIHKDYHFLFKTNNRFYSSNNLIEALEKAHEIVFFGHSINGMDFPYFKDFFKKQSLPSKDFKRKRITIFTFDDESEERIRDNFREEGINLRDLMSRNELMFIETKKLDNGDEHEEDKFDRFLSHLEEDSKDTENMLLKRLEQDMLY